MPFPGRNVLGHDCPLRVVGIESTQTGRNKLDFTGCRLKAFSGNGLGLGMRPPIGCILRPVFGKPAQGGCGLIVFRQGHNVITFSLEILPGDMLWQISQIKVAFDPIKFIHSVFGVSLEKSQTFG